MLNLERGTEGKSVGLGIQEIQIPHSNTRSEGRRRLRLTVVLRETPSANYFGRLSMEILKDIF